MKPAAGHRFLIAFPKSDNSICLQNAHFTVRILFI